MNTPLSWPVITLSFGLAIVGGIVLGFVLVKCFNAFHSLWKKNKADSSAARPMFNPNDPNCNCPASRQRAEQNKKEDKKNG